MKRQRYSKDIKARVALDAIKGQNPKFNRRYTLAFTLGYSPTGRKPG